MNATNVLQRWSQERSQLAAALAPRTVAIALGAHRCVSGIRWRGPYIVTAAEALAGSDAVMLVSEHGETRAPVVACDLATDVALLRVSDDQTYQLPTGSAPAADDAVLEAGAGVIIVGRGRRGPRVGFGTVRVAGPAWRSRRGGDIAQRLEFDATLDHHFEGALVADLTGVPRAMLVRHAAVCSAYRRRPSIGSWRRWSSTVTCRGRTWDCACRRCGWMRPRGHTGALGAQYGGRGGRRARLACRCRRNRPGRSAGGHRRGRDRRRGGIGRASGPGRSRAHGGAAAAPRRPGTDTADYRGRIAPAPQLGLLQSGAIATITDPMSLTVQRSSVRLSAREREVLAPGGGRNLEQGHRARAFGIAQHGEISYRGDTGEARRGYPGRGGGCGPATRRLPL